MKYDFDKVIDRRGTGASKWDKMESLFGVAPEDGLPMWVADSEFSAPPCVTRVVQQAAEHGIFGYGYHHEAYLESICWWMRTRHGWEIDPDWILTTQGLGNAIALCLDVWSDPGDRIAFFTPVYHEFRQKALRANREPLGLPLRRKGDDFLLDLDDAAARLSGDEKILIWSSPQNPTGRIWSREELRSVAQFAKDNGMLLISDEIHHDLILADQPFLAMDRAAPELRDNLVVMTAASKTFNLAGQRVGNIIIPDPDLRSLMKDRLTALNFDPNVMGVHMVTAAYSPEGAQWVDAQVDYIRRNHQLFQSRLDAIPGIHVLPAQATFLAWVDFGGTGLAPDAILDRVQNGARIAASHGRTFDDGCDQYLRFNLGAPRSMVETACDRLAEAFADLR